MSTPEQRRAKRAYARATRDQRARWDPNYTPGPVGHPFVPTALIIPYLEARIAELGLRAVNNLAGPIGAKGLYDIRYGHRAVLRFDTADRLLCIVIGHPEYWWENPELNAIYQEAV